VVETISSQLKRAEKKQKILKSRGPKLQSMPNLR